MNKITKTALSLLSILVLGVVTLTPLTITAAESTPDKHYNDWMSQISDNTRLSSISIPGTHDSATEYCTLPFFTSCQDTSIAEQLSNGYRYIDVRLMLNDNKNGFILNHGGFKCHKSLWPWSDKITFDDIVSDAYNFLDSNPTETVIYAVKIENKNDDIATCEQLIQDAISKNPDKWYTKNEIPALIDARGKIVLATRYEDVLNVGEEKSGLKFIWEEQDNKEVTEIPYAQSMINSKQSLWVQDRYKYKIDDKFNAFCDGLDNCLASDDTFFINFLSLSGQDLIPYPKGNADILNRRFNEKSLQKGTCYGIIVVDRANKDMASKIFETNI